MSEVFGIREKLKLIQNELLPSKQKEVVPREKTDSIEISNTSKAFIKLDNFLNLGKPDRLDVQDLNPEERKEFMKMLSKLLEEGIVGYEVREINGKPEKHYIVNEIGDERLYRAKLYKKKGYFDQKERNLNRYIDK